MNFCAICGRTAGHLTRLTYLADLPVCYNCFRITDRTHDINKNRTAILSQELQQKHMAAGNIHEIPPTPIEDI